MAVCPIWSCSDARGLARRPSRGGCRGREPQTSSGLSFWADHIESLCFLDHGFGILGKQYPSLTSFSAAWTNLRT